MEASGFPWGFVPCAVPWRWGLLKLGAEISFKTGQKTLGRGWRIFGSAACCPTGFCKAVEIVFAPQVGTQQAVKPLEAAAPLAGHRLVTEQDINQQRAPHLPKDRIFAVAEKIAQLQRLLDLLEKRFDRPSTFVQVGDTRRCPGRVVGDLDSDEGEGRKHVHPPRAFVRLTRRKTRSLVSQ